MSLQLTPYHLPLLFSVLLSLVVAGLAIRNRETPGCRPLAVFALAAGVWTVAEIGNLSVTGTATKVFWTNVEITVSTVVPAAFLLIALEYTGRLDRLNRPFLALLAVEPLVLTALVWTNGHGHRLVRSETGRRLVNDSYYIITETFGPAFFGHVVYSYALIAASLVLIARTSVIHRGIYLLQSASFIAGCLIVLVANVAYVLELTPDGLDPTNVAFVACSGVFLFAIRSQRLLDVVPATREFARDELVTNLPDAIVVLNGADRVVDLNPVAEEVFEVENADVIGEPVRSVVPEFTTILDEDRSDLRLTRDGQQRYYDAQQSPIDRGFGTVTGRLVTLRDVTDRKQTEDRYQTLIDRSLDLITILDESGVIKYESPSIRHVLGYSPDELIGENAFEYVHPDDRAETLDVFYQDLVAEDPGAEAATEFRFEDCDGNYRWLSARARNLNDDPRIAGFVVNLREVTDRKRHEQQRNVMHRLLRHNLRNDMTVVRGYADLLAERADDNVDEYAAAIDERLEKVVSRSDKLKRVTTRLDSGDSRSLDLTAVLDSAIQSGRERRDDATITTDICALPPVRANEAIEIAFTELVENPLEHGGEEPRVHVAAEADDETVTVTVSDDGPGIPDAELEPLRNDRETALKHGSGVGLWLVSWVVQSLSGDLAFDVEDGTTVTVELPRASTQTA
ncbi:histidine kinase N-terminal 7TM domain-containing protein [Haloarchaeobius sp. TZWSO28]|uniref:histidine kinase N-terminal 7TM domain-containing protein n=1 Tax=Haloarchaeobius sp. TZWSO28 TaxID=3446119 RepID=UPI003EBAA9A4